MNFPTWIDITSFIHTQILTNQIFSGAVLAGAILGLLNKLKDYPVRFVRFLMDRCVTTVRIDNTDELFPYFIIWMSRQNFDWFLRDYQVSSFKYNGDDSAPVSAVDAIGVPDGFEYTGGKFRKNKEPYTQSLSPSDGTYFIRIYKKFFKLTYHRKDSEIPVSTGNKPVIYQSIALSYLGKNTDHIQKILSEVNAIKSELKPPNAVYVYVPDSECSWWSEFGVIADRPIESFAFDPVKKKAIVDDVLRFGSNRLWYNKRGIPYRRGYLFHGKPGTGKTSLIKILATILKKNVYFFNFSSILTDEKYLNLLSETKPNSIVVFEDIDCLFDESRKTKIPLNFSTLINSFDGIAAKEGCMIFITTNYLDKLDEALIRAGRIDYKLEFPYCSRQQMSDIFKTFFPDASEDEQKTFARSIHEFSESPANIQQFLMKYQTKEEVLANIR